MDFFGGAACQAWVGEILAALKAEGEEIHVPQDLITQNFSWSHGIR